MATVTLRSLHAIPSITATPTAGLKYQKCPSLSSPFSKTFFLTKQKPLPLQISPLTAWRISAYASAPYTQEEEEIENQTGEEVVLVPVQPAKAEPKRLKKDRARLYVGNLPYSATSNELAELFSEAGTVTTADVVYDRVTDRSRGFGFVTMATVEEANEAIRMFDGSQLGGRSIRVNFPEVPRGAEREVLTVSSRPSKGYVDSPHKIYAGNLGWGVNSEMLQQAFSNQSGLLGAKVIFDRETGLSRGFGFVSFASAEDAQAALESMDGVEVEGRPLRLKFSHSSSASNSSLQETVTKMQESSLETSSVSV
ncbi:ribonucleoprotein [Carex littledalei]|uniref:Ribonucleoprotein n=1 Tax=Carex littledalei TaxID=544730 RepID=A0A833R599_9POAL|nr:ribonucleoprotein [Carex littledalei]